VESFTPRSLYHREEIHVTHWVEGLMGPRSGSTHRDSSLFHNSKTALGPTHPPVQCIPWVRRPVGEADHPPPSSAEVKNSGNILSFPSRLHGVVAN
jgi:hypothetical protein